MCPLRAAPPPIRREQAPPWWDPAGPCQRPLSARWIWDRFAPTAKQIFDPGANTFTLPVVVDAFQDGLPILYYRRAVGVETAANTGAAPGTIAGYYYDENKEYTTTSLKATSGSTYAQSSSNFGAGDLNKIVSVDQSTGGKVRGGYVLISAGIDRFFGTVTSGSVKKNDDLTLVGGD